MVLPADELSFYFAAAGQLAPELRPVFADRVASHLAACPCPGAGDVDRAVRQALAGLWTPPAIEERPARWDRDRPSFNRVSRAARLVGEKLPPKLPPNCAEKGGFAPDVPGQRLREPSINRAQLGHAGIGWDPYTRSG